MTLNTKLDANAEEQADATNIRSKENAEYTAETTETKEAEVTFLTVPKRGIREGGSGRNATFN